MSLTSKTQERPTRAVLLLESVLSQKADSILAFYGCPEAKPLQQIFIGSGMSHAVGLSDLSRNMEKKIILLMLMALFSMFANAQQISYIKADGAWYQVYDEAGKKVTTLSKSSIGEVVGWGSDFFVAVDGAWVKTYDIKGKKICTLSKQTVGEVIGVSGNTFTSRQSAWIYIWNKEGKKLQTRSA